MNTVDRPSKDAAPAGLRGVKLVISGAHQGLKAAIAKVMNASWQRCRVHFMRNVVAQKDEGATEAQWRKVAADQPRPTLPKLALLMDPNAICSHVRAFPKDHWQKIQFANGVERLDGEIERPTEVSASSPTKMP